MVEALGAWYKGSLTPSLSINAKMVQRQKHQKIMLINWVKTSSMPIETSSLACFELFLLLTKTNLSFVGQIPPAPWRITLAKSFRRPQQRSDAAATSRSGHHTDQRRRQSTSSLTATSLARAPAHSSSRACTTSDRTFIRTRSGREQCPTHWSGRVLAGILLRAHPKNLDPDQGCEAT